MATTGYNHKGILDAIRSLNTGIFLPDLQRPYVWEEEQILKLFDSLMRGYPINTFLFWKVTREILNKRQYPLYLFVDNNNIESSAEQKSIDSTECMLVLDGQQRLTSLFIGLRGFWIKGRQKRHRLYFNLLSDHTKVDSEILYEFAFLPESVEQVIVDGEKVWMRAWAIIDALETDKKEPAGLAMEVATKANIPASDSKYLRINKNIDRFNNSIICGQIYYYEESEDSEDKVLDIFVRTNAGGTKLGYSDLLFSKIKVSWREHRDAREAFKETLLKMNDGGFEFDNDFILKAALVCLATDSEQVRFRLSNFTPLKVETIRTEWNRLQKSLFAAKDLLAALHIANDKQVPSYNALIPLVSFAYLRGLSTFGSKKDPWYNNIREYVYRSFLTAAFSAQVDTRLWNIQEQLHQHNGDEFPTQPVFTRLRGMGHSLEVQEEAIRRIRYGSRLSHSLMNLVYNRANLDFKPASTANQIQQDHIFSQGELHGKHPDEFIHDIANIRLVTFNENRWKWDMPYADWIKTTTPEERKLHLIPDGEWTAEAFPKFLEERRKLIVERINNTLRQSNN